MSILLNRGTALQEMNLYGQFDYQAMKNDIECFYLLYLISRPPLPKSKQNSMALLKKAMSQAQESTSVFPAAGQFTEPVRMIVKSASQSGGSMKIVARRVFQ